MRKNGKKALSLLLALVLVLGMLPGAAGAAEETVPQTEEEPVAETVPSAAQDVQIEASEDAQPEAPEELRADEELQENPQADEEPSPVLELYADTVTYAVTGGNLYLNPATGTITDCDTSVTSANIPSSIGGVAVTGIGGSAFSGCTGLTSVVIPDSVTSIERSAFSDCTGLTSVTIPDSVTSIGGWAFSGCTGLTSVTIGNSITSIEWGAFYGCTSLTGVTIPDSVTSIEGRAFYGCTGLTGVTIPDSVTSIGDWVFRGCTGLTGIQVETGNQKYTSIDGVLFTKGGETLELRDYPEGKQGPYMIPDSVTSIGDDAFYGCIGLTSVTIPNRVANIGDQAFQGCTGLTGVTISNGVTNIGYRAFSGCTALTSVTVPSSVTKIEPGVFAGCGNLIEIQIDSNNQAYTAVDGVIFDKSETALICYPAGRQGAYTVPDGVTDFGGSAFSGCTGLTNVTIPSSVTSIDWGGAWGGVFEGCTGLTTAGPIGGGYDIQFGWTEEIPAEAFYDCRSLTSVTIPDSITSIGRDAFAGCTGLTSVTIPDSVTSMGEYAFRGCTGLTSVTIGNSVTSIEYQTFGGCTGLKDVYYSGSEAQWSAISIDSGNTELTNATIHYNSRPTASYTVTFRLNNGTGTINPNNNTKTVTNGEPYGDLPTPNHYNSGYKFDGWFTSPSGGTQITSSTIVNLTADQELYAHWTYIPVTNTVTFNANGGEGTMEAQTITRNSPLIVGVILKANTFTRSGYRFTGWNTQADGSGTSYTNEESVVLKSDLTLYAQWEVAPTYTLAFDANGGIGSMPAQTFEQGVAQSLNTNTLTRSGYTFTGWNTRADGSGISYSDGQAITLDADLTLYAQWEAAKTYTVTFLAEGGNPNQSTKDVITGQPYGDLPAPAYRTGGKYFDGWYTERDGGVQIFESTIVNLSGNQTLYAHWGDLPAVIPPVVFTGEATDVDRSSAVFHAELFDNGGDENLTLEFVYWNKLEASTRYTVAATDSGKTFSATVRNLSPGTTYYYYAKASNSAGEGAGSSLSLTTEPEEEPVSISVEPVYLSLETGDTYQLLATVLPATAANRAVTWSSSDNSAVSVDANGAITAQKAGTGVVITATTAANGLTAICTVDVSDPSPDPEIKGAFDFSELNMASNTGNYARDGIGFDSLHGGNALKATAYLSRWDGAVLEENDPYPAYDGNHSAHYREVDSDYHVQDIYWIPARRSSSDNDEIKAAVMKYGAVYEAFLIHWSYFDVKKTNYYYPSNGTLSDGGHAVAVVGWDDNYPASNFTVTPPGNGAFICRNSWGENGSGDGGYFYVSYYDKYFGIRNGGGMVIPSVEKDTNYTKIYQYDPLGACSALGDNSATYAANIFPEKGKTLQSDEKLSAVSFYTYSKNTSYEVYVVTDYQTKASLQKKGPAVASGIQNEMGYHTVVLNSPVLLKAGTRFAVIVKLSVGSGKARVYYEYPISGYSSNARANADEGYFSYNAISWTDLTSYASNANFCIKAFTDGGENNVQLLEGIDNDSRSYENDKVYTLDEVLASGIRISEEYVEWAQSASLLEQDEDGMLGDVLNIIDRGGNDVSFIDGAILPEKYDLREQGCVSEIRDQGGWSHCWTFASYASLESCLLKKAKTISADSLSGGLNIGDVLAEVGQSGISVKRLKLSEQSLTLSKGDTRRITATFEPVNATSSALHWSSGNENVATIDTNGIVTARGAGETSITARTGNGIAASCTVTVSDTSTGIGILSVTLESGTASATVQCDVSGANIYCAGYTASGQLVSTSIKPVTSGTQTYDFKMNHSVHYVKVFLVRKDMVPLCPGKQTQFDPREP